MEVDEDRKLPAPYGSAMYCWFRISEAVGLDRRSLALFRIATGITIIGDLIDRAMDLETFYADNGLLPRTSVLRSIPAWWSISLHMAGGSTVSQFIFFLLHAICAFCMAVGYHTRLATFFTWFMVNSLQVRNPYILHGGDIYMRCIMFWAIFLPLGDVWSLDAFHREEKLPSPARRKFLLQHHALPSGGSPKTPWVTSFATLGYMLQIAYMYSFSYLCKTAKEWRIEYSATFYALQLDYFRMPLGDFFLFWTPFWFTQVLTFAVLYWEGFGPLCFFSPVQHGPLRLAGAVGFLLMHLGFGLCMRLGTFFWICSSGLLALLPGYFWDSLVFSRHWLVTCRAAASRVTGYYYLPSPYSPDAYKDDVSDGRRLRRWLTVTAAKYIKTFFLFRETLLVPVMKRKSLVAMSPGSSASNLVVLVDGKATADVSALLSLMSAAPLLQPLSAVLWPLYLRRHNNALLVLCGRAFALALRLLDPLILIPFGGWANGEPPGYHDRAVDKGDDANTVFDIERQAGPVASNLLMSGSSLARPMRAHTATNRSSNSWLRRMGTLVVQLFLLYIIVYTFRWNLSTVGYPQWGPKSPLLGVALHLDQKWSMFSPRPSTLDWWQVIQGKLANGTTVDLYTNGALFSFRANPWRGDEFETKPYPLHKTIGGHRWFKIWEGINLRDSQNELKLRFGQWLCRHYNAIHGQKSRALGNVDPTDDDPLLETFELYLMADIGHLDGTSTRQKPLLLWQHRCFDRTPDVRKSNTPK